MTAVAPVSSKVATARRYYELADQGSPELLDLFTPEFEFHFPKYGVGRGRAEFVEFSTGLMASLRAVRHRIDAMRFVEAGDVLCVEGTSEGRTADGRDWSGGAGPGGRFCSIFDFEGQLISRMFSYLDPDYGGLDAAGFRWHRTLPRW